MRRRSVGALLALLLGSAHGYVVQPGDTLYRVAARAGTTPQAIQALNQLNTTTLTVGQTLRLPASVQPAVPTPGQAANPASLAGRTTRTVGGVTVTFPAHLRMGDAFTVRLVGPDASQATVQFPSEVGEDVRQPDETLHPLPGDNKAMVLGRVVLGKLTPLTYRVVVGDQVLTGNIPVSGQVAGLQELNLPASTASKLKDPARAVEEAQMEQAYTLRTPQVWTQPFSGALNVTRIVTVFGQRRTYVQGGPVKYHYGIDYPAPAGTPVRAVNDGTVVIAGTFPVRGGLVVIDHGAGLLSLYFHQSKTLAQVGQQVKRGQVIGLVGTTGVSTGPHLHLELRLRGEAVQPLEWLGKLLP